MSVLPQMKSIWLDEDEEAEKLYGLQAQQFMGPDDEDALSIRMVNSDKPFLSNKKKIDLSQLTKNKFRMTRPSPTTKNLVSNTRGSNGNNQKFKSGFLNLFKNKDVSHGRHKKISTPFQFQHISHADAKTGFESEDERDEQGSTNPEDELLHPVCSEGCEQHHCNPRSSVVQENSALHKRASSARFSSSGSVSTSSSKISRFSTGAAGRVVSTSTMATSIQNDHSRVGSSNSLGKSYMKHRYTGSDGGYHNDYNNNNQEGTLEFLKNYHFPSGLDNNALFNFTPEMRPHKISTPIIEAESCYSQEEPSLVSSKNVPGRLSRHKSDPNLLSTPQMENKWFDDGTPATRRSLDDLLRYYQEPSAGTSPLQLALEVGSPLQAAIEQQSIHVDTPLDFSSVPSVTPASPI